MSLATTVIPIAPVYGWNILAGVGMAFHVILVGGWASSVRRKYNVEYPDMGSGRFTEKLTDDQWRDFNNHQRAHYNYVEGISSAITLQLLGGLFYPKTVAWLGLLYIVGRHAYAYGYMSYGATGRRPGAILLDLALASKLILTVYGCLRLIGYPL